MSESRRYSDCTVMDLLTLLDEVEDEDLEAWDVFVDETDSTICIVEQSTGKGYAIKAQRIPLTNH